MSRRCACDRLLELTETDPRFRLAGPAAAMLFVWLVRAAARIGSPGVWPFGSVKETAVGFGIPEPDAETALETLRNLGLIERRDDGAILIPAAETLSPRQSSGRTGAARGGRPRRGETAEAARERRQREMLLPMPPAPKPPETGSETLARAATATSTSEVAVEGGSGGNPPEWVSLGAEVAELAGLDPVHGGHDFRPVQGWLQAGHDAEAIRETIRRVAARPGYDGRRVRSLRYFDRAIATGAEPAAVARIGHVPRPSDDDLSPYSRHVRALIARGEVAIPSRAQFYAAGGAAACA